MKLSMIIIALNEQAVIRRCVQSAWQAGADEVIVADGGSRDQTRARVEGQCRWISSAPGRATQQNQGAAAAQGDVFVFLHADCWFEGNAARQIREALSRPEIVGGCFRQSIDDGRRIYRWVEEGNALRAKWCGLPYGDQGIFVRRAPFWQLGGFPDVPLMEDLMFTRQLRRQGKLALLPGPLHISARRWRKRGVLRQTLRNWLLLTAFFCGVSPHRLSRFYPRHDAT